jgi:threonine dehydrogenase-like Zn-dependent dehydrogenase
MLFLLRCAVHDGVPDIDRHSDVHPQDPGRQSGRICEDHLRAEHLGGMCARVCPTETLCEEVCVRETAEGKPVKIGLLQRYATDTFMEREQPHPFTRAAPTGKKIAVIGAGPAGLSCAHRLATLGHDVTIFEAREKGRRPQRIWHRLLQDDQ